MSLIGRILCGVSLAAVASFVTWESGLAGEPRVIRHDPALQLVLDSRIVQSAENARLKVGSVEKATEGPLFAADRPWENSLNNLYPNVSYDPNRGLFEMWYKCVLHDADVIARMERPTTIHEQGWFLLYATSRDGLAWTKPAVDQQSFDGSRRNNAVTRDTPNAGVLFDPRDPDPQRRYKMIYDVGPGKIRTRFSGDGVTWSEPREPEGYSSFHGDTHNNAFWDARTNRFVLISRAYLGERLVARFESEDFQHWRSTGIVMRSSLAEGRETQTYCMTAFTYGSVYLAYLMMYHPGRDRSVDCELAWSPDSIAWHRVRAGHPFIPRGPAGSGDSACIYAPAGPAIVQDGRIRIYYGGSDEPHLGWKRHCLPRLATLREDGFAGYEPVDRTRPAIVTTQPLLVENGIALTVSANADKGSLRVRVLDAADFPDILSEPVVTDDSNHVVRWKDRDSRSLAGQVVRLQFELNGAVLYGFRGLRQIPAPTIDTDVRRFDDSLSFHLEDTGVPTGAKLRFTLDGSEPSASSSVADRPQHALNLAATTRLRARWFVASSGNGGPELDARFEKRSPAAPRKPAVTESFRFESDAEEWIGLDRILHHPAGGLAGGFVSLNRDGGLRPFARLPHAQNRISGDWPQRFGGAGATISFALRSEGKASGARVELFASDIGAWTRDFGPAVGPDWQRWTTTIRWDWNDAEAEAAGWRRSPNAFSWQETIRHIGHLVVMPAASHSSSFDFDEFAIRSWPAE